MPPTPEQLSASQIIVRVHQWRYISQCRIEVVSELELTP